MANKYWNRIKPPFRVSLQARNKYTYFASKAKKDGFEQIADLFLKNSRQ